MSTNDNKKNSHDMIDHIFHDLLPARGMVERPEQVSLSHLMLDSMLDGSIALCDAGTGTGKTYSYLTAGAAFLHFRATSGLKLQPIIVSTSSIELNTQLKALAEEKQSVLERLDTFQQEAERQALQASRQQELEEWLDQRPMVLTEYDGSVTRRLVERVTVADVETIRVKLRDIDVETEEKLC